MVNQVLCIDDDIISQTISQLLLKRAAFASEIKTANDGQEAIGLLVQMTSQLSFDARNAPSLVFLDLNMPEMDGWSFLDHYVKHFEPLLPYTRIIILSSTIDPADALRAREYPVVIQFLHKPLQVDNLEALKKHEMFHQFFSA
ncbi:MAG: response regulator [Sphingobacteriia bacterium]|nr:MAG: response regulator [Sphingobacteriia bacterium]